MHRPMPLEGLARLYDDLFNFVGRGTHTGELMLGEAMTIPPTGRRAALTFQDTLNVRAGLIVQSLLDFDVTDLRRQLSPDPR